MCKNKMKVYISGKIGNLPDRNIPKFDKAEQLLIAKGFDTVNPHKLDHSQHNKTWHAYMEVDLKALHECDAIYLLDDWMHSPGARIELRHAIEMEIPILDEQQVNAMI